MANYLLLFLGRAAQPRGTDDETVALSPDETITFIQD